METFIYKDKKKLRCGYTTGTCAALAAKAAACFLATGVWPEEIEITTPSGQNVQAEVLRASAGNAAAGKVDSSTGSQRPDSLIWAECAIKKDAGDDPDVTDELLIFSRVEIMRVSWESECGSVRGENIPDAQQDHLIIIDGGKGVGRVTKPGLDQPVGAAAINSMPQKMIAQAVSEVFEECGEMRPVKVTVSVPEGEKVAEKTFNPNLGIVGGISILGTSGIVEPMSDRAIVDTIRANLSVIRAEGHEFAAAVPGNMGAEFLRRYLVADIPTVICSNFVGETIDLAGELGFQNLLLAGHIGKFVKLGNGIMNTHSREADGRMDTLVSCALTAGADLELLKEIQQANTTNEAVEILREHAFLMPVINVLLERIDRHVNRRAIDGLHVGVILFGQDGEFLGKTGAVGRMTPRKQ